jgi:hypothetical protein
MRKGCTSLQNVQLLKWCKQFGIRPIWNILWGFPGEEPQEYDQMAKMIRSLGHLEPPQVAASLRLDRFSPYFEAPEQFGFRNTKPYPAYSYVYKLPEEALRNLAYYYTFEYERPQDPSQYAAKLKQAVVDWRANREDSDLFMTDLDAALVIFDTRAARPAFHILTGVERELYLACDAVRGAPVLERMVSARDWSARLSPIVDQLIQRRLMLRDGDSYVSLAVMLGDYHPQRKVRLRFMDAVHSCGQRRGHEWEIGHLGWRFPDAPGTAEHLRSLALGPEHFRIAQDGGILVHMDALERIDLELVGANLWR